MLRLGPVERKHFVDVNVNAVYWYFVVLAWWSVLGRRSDYGAAAFILGNPQSAPRYLTLMQGAGLNWLRSAGAAGPRASASARPAAPRRRWSRPICGS